MKTSLASSSGPWRLALLAGFAFAAVSPLAAETDKSIHKTFDVAPGGNLVVDIGSGGIDVQGTTGSQVVIDFTRRVSAGSEEEEERILREQEVTIEQTGNTVTIRSKHSRGGNSGSWWSSLFGGSNNRKFHLKVSVPDKFNVDLKTSGGGIDVAQLTGTVKTNTSGGGLGFKTITGDIDGRTSGGGIDLDHCKGTIVVHTSGGGIDVADSEGPLDVDTSGGGITIDTHHGNVKAVTSGGGIRLGDIAGNVEAHTSGGSIRADITIQPTADCRLDTSGGGITVTLPGNVAMNIDAATSAGHVSSELPVTITGEHKKDHLRGTINGGGPELHLRSSAGGIDINKGADTNVAAVEK